MAQQQIIHSEKMASLGQLTAGIAHEINNPISFITSYTEAIQLNLKDIDPILKKVKTLGGKPAEVEIEEIQQLRDQIDLSYLQQEMGELLDGIHNGTKRTAEIVKSLKYFSHTGQGRKEKVDLLQIMDTTLDIMQSEFKQLTQINKAYQAIPLIPVEPGQFNQVFFNILSNAMDAIRSKYPPKQPPLGLITITTREEPEEVLIAIRDNGPGISTLVGTKVFDPFFTTKSVGAGAGLASPLVTGSSSSMVVALNWPDVKEMAPNSGYGFPKRPLLNRSGLFNHPSLPGLCH